MPNENVLAAFNVRGASLRAKLIKALAESLGEQVPSTALMRAVYGNEQGSKSSFASIVDGVDEIIKTRHLDYKLKRVKVDKEITLGLHPS